MRKTGKLKLFILCGLLFTISIFLTQKNYVEASQVLLPDEYFFIINGQKKKAGVEYEMTKSELMLNIAADKWASETTVEWTSSERGVVELEPGVGPSFVKLVRKGPGYSTITAVVKQGTNTYSISCLIKVKLEFDVQKTGLTTAKTTNDRILIIDKVNEKKTVYLKFVDYYDNDDSTSAITGSAISASAVEWVSDNEGVATVDDNGKVTAVGSGSTLITATSQTMSSTDKPMSISLTVVVAPKFSLSYADAAGKPHVVASSNKKGVGQPAMGVPSNFVIESEATMAENLTWVVEDSSTGKKLPKDGPKLRYSVSDLSGNVSFTNVKAGTYEIYAFANKDYNMSTNAPYAYMKIVVPIDVRDKSIVMNVQDTYDVMKNSNIPDIDIFTYTYLVGNPNIARIDENGLITAMRSGQVKLRLVYRTEHDLYDDQIILDGDVVVNIDLDITVIDGIALNLTNATMYTGGTLLLHEKVTDPTEGLTWTTSDKSIATVDRGMVTAKKAGVVTITVHQTVGGVTKSASCVITVQKSVSKITIDPAKVTMAIGGYQTLLAKITPADLSGVQLQWRSSNESVVKIVDSSALTATIQGVSGGSAVITAINQDNVIVGFTHVTVLKPVASIVLSETNISLDMSTKRVQLRATVYPEDAVNKKVLWTTTDASVATVNENGLVTLLKPGKVSIIATSDDSPKVRAICNITIDVPVGSVTLDDKELTMYVGQTHRLSYVLQPLNASKNSVIWTTTNSKVATVDATGKVTARSVGTAIIMLKSVDGNYSTYTTINVKRIASGIKFDISNLSLKTGEYYYVNAQLTPKDSTDTNLVWESSDPKVATVDANGKITARTAGTTIVMAKTENGAMAYTTVTVTQGVEGLILNFSDKTIYVGEEFDLKASVSPSNATELRVDWKSSNTKVATVSKDGEVKGLIGGVAVITVTTVDGKYVATCVVTVRELVTSIKLNHESVRIGKDKSIRLEATVSNETATNKKVTWTSSDEKIATVNSSGKVTGLKYGFAVITATAQDDSEVQAEVEVEVVRPVSRITVKNGYVSMYIGDTKQAKATLEPKNATYNEIKWTSSDTSIAIVDEDGYITGINEGNATIIAQAHDDSGKSATVYVTVHKRISSTAVTVMDKNLVMVSGETKNVSIALSPINSTDGVSWSSDNAGVASVDKKTGKITARSTGTAYITVMTDTGKTAKIEVTVIGLNRTKLTLEQYTEYFLYVEGATGTVRWDVENPNVATVRNGRVVARAIGNTNIIATVNGRSIRCTLKVTKIK